MPGLEKAVPRLLYVVPFEVASFTSSSYGNLNLYNTRRVPEAFSSRVSSAGQPVIWNCQGAQTAL